MKIFRNADLYAPKHHGIKDILVCSGKIVAIEDEITMTTNIQYEEIDCKGKKIIPGIIDNHIHLCGGGGEAGFESRINEINLEDLTRNGITTAIGLLGTDGFTKNMKGLLAKVKALNNQGVTAFAVTGSYQIPVKTLVDSIEDDIVFFEEIIGVGEIALSDHRDSAPTSSELKKIISSSRVAGLISNKAGVTIIHMGDGLDGLDKIVQMTKDNTILKSKILPTHITRNERLFRQGIEYAKSGGFIDMTANETTYDYVLTALREDVPIKNITCSSDAMGSLPVFDEQGKMIGMEVGKPDTMLKAIRDLVNIGHMDLSEALKPFTSNVAELFLLKNKGGVEVGKDADLLILDSDNALVATFAKGNCLFKSF